MEATMEKPLFANFLQVPGVYKQAEKFWQDRWLQLLMQSGQTDCWTTPWINTSFADGTEFQDGNPIFSAIRSDGQSGIRIIQLDAAETTDTFTHWFDDFGAPGSERVKELVICCILTEKNGLKAIDLIRKFIEKEEKTLESMN